MNGLSPVWLPSWELLLMDHSRPSAASADGSMLLDYSLHSNVHLEEPGRLFRAKVPIQLSLRGLRSARLLFRICGLLYLWSTAFPVYRTPGATLLFAKFDETPILVRISAAC